MHIKSFLLVSTACFIAAPAALAAGDNAAAAPEPLMVIASNAPTQKPSLSGAATPTSTASSAQSLSTDFGQESDFVHALTHGTPLFDMRYRYENVEQKGLAHQDGFANTVRTRLGYETGTFDHVKARVQLENLMPVGNNDHYNDNTNGLTTFPAIVDPRTTAALYEANATWTGLPQSALTVGRETLALDNERWVGKADWRQLGQTMDGLTADNKSIDNLDLSYSYVFRVNRIYGDRAIASSTSAAGVAGGDFDSNIHLFRAAYTGVPGVKYVGYGYLLGLNNAPILSSQTYGARVEVDRPVYGDVSGLFNAEYARQFNYDNNPIAFGYNYYAIEPGAHMGPFTAKIGYEALGGDGNHALQAPLNTGHSFNGWAEKFLSTPAGGVDNLHMSAEYKSPDYNEWLNSTVLKAVWYDFTADNSSKHYGNEYDFWAGQTFYKHYTLGLEYAQYNADKLFTDTRKYVLQLQVKY